MEKESKVSSRVGKFNSEEDFSKYINIDYDENGNNLPSIFMEEFGGKNVRLCSGN